MIAINANDEMHQLRTNAYGPVVMRRLVGSSGKWRAAAAGGELRDGPAAGNCRERPIAESTRDQQRSLR